MLTSIRSASAILLLAVLPVIGCEDPPERDVVVAGTADADHRRAAGLLSRYDYDDAVQLLSAVVEDDPGRTDARIDLEVQ